ncbi:MAG: hypothetical protein M3Q07_19735 [Pseudobdellovibrionaceae bacterium]|uniref:hypothetical protein n=1 Tax=Oligoflexus sp. TaxID=1971216 RepID=UPI0027CB8811|nr:hypothetical protein [Oligoflexus sp.]MDQ3234047.1 hypothetical protein [Pseudobdellovibrionaceae bacterium]HYX33312.1 hypothetical protein [Oligoflexus sp.]
MRFVSSTLFLAVLTLSCSSQPKDQIVPASLQETSAPLTATADAKTAAPDCSDDMFCTREYLPTTCQFSGESFEGSNPCEARKLAKRFACEKKLNFADTAVQCQPKSKKGSAK